MASGKSSGEEGVLLESSDGKTWNEISKQLTDEGVLRAFCMSLPVDDI